MIDQSVKKTKINDFDFYVITNDWMGMSFLDGKLWEPHITQFIKNELNSDSLFVDVGSNYGYHSIFASKMCKKVYSFEPHNIMFKLQKKNIEENKIENIVNYNFAIGNENRKVKLTSFDSLNESFNAGEISIILNDIEGSDIDMFKLDDIVDEKIDLIKIDVQGFEKNVIEGSKKNIQKYNPYLIVEFENHQLSKFGYTSEYLFRFIQDLGYEIFLLDYFYPSDFVCVHKNKLDNFTQKNSSNIKEILENNTLNNCLEFGINKKIFYSEEITSGLIRNFKLV